MKVAIVHDWLIGMGGADKVVAELHKLFPDAPIYTSVVNYDKLDPEFREMDIRTTFIQKLPFSKTKYNRYLPLFPIAFEAFDLREYDLIISSTASIGVKGVIRDSSSAHICYCHTPPRYSWDFYHEYLNYSGWFQRKIIPFLMHYLRMYDQLSANRVDYYISNSTIVKERIKKIYQRDAEIIHPPVDVERFKMSTESEDFYLVVSRLVPYKKIDLAVQACSQLNKRLIVIGSGSELNNLKQMAGPSVEFLGYQSDEIVKEYMQKCNAFLFPGYEDFGIAPVEAQACGKPVIAYGKGGALDTVIPKKTGVLFNDQSVESLVEAINEFEKTSFDPIKIRIHAEQFSSKRFRDSILELVETIIQEN
ncbi:glycosyl transferase [Ureibacillus massiliensis 4400831 = CIP 108448 = CCUG 49529]|uniref:Glycosyl transferase n=1 Tax=Ureibacillus massiliensis 4400831 = CIP 108448 = CCUG 49529 TaxID=1211035 RepID=A0A0A3IZ94_9BACL|nr:glycosyltransferase [Ureibacillus massiliensis]KGR90031.1 glycosyl transferase [Ureibacillus massiliensis 4400831 = CIP 108448 = CCUG 49529]